MNKYEMKTNITLLTRKRDTLVKKLADIGPFVGGSLVKIKRRCGNKNCKCTLKDEKPENYFLMYKTKRLTKAVYVPVDLEEEVRS